MPKTRPVADVSGRPLDLRDVDLDTFLNPKTIAVIGASEQSAKPNTAMTRKFAAWSKQHGAAFYPVHPTYETVLGHRCYASLADVPGDLDLAIILTGRAVDTFEEVLQRKAKFAVIFAAGFSETGPEGEKLERRLEGLVESGEVRLLGPNTNLNAFEEFRDDLEGPSIALITQSGHQGRPVFQGQEIGIRLTHWAPTGNEVDLEFADFARYFADQDEVGVIACYIEGFKDGRTLMLAADHAAQLQKPMVMVKVGRTAAGQSMAASHTGHLTGSDAVTSAVFRQFGVTRVDGLDDLLEVSAALARTRPDAPPMWAKRQRQPGICVYAISGGTGAHMADLVSAAGLRIPDLTKKSQQALHDGLIPSYLRVSNPVDCGGPPVADARPPDPRRHSRRRQHRHRHHPDHRCRGDVLRTVHARHHRRRAVVEEADLRRVGSTVRHRRHVLQAAARRGPSRVPHLRQLHRRGARYQDYWTFAARYRSPFDDAPIDPSPAAKKARALLADLAPGEALSEWRSKQLLKAYGIKSSKDELVNSAAAAVRAAAALGYPVVMKVSSPDLLHKSDAGLVEIGVGSAKEVRATYDALLAKARKADKHARIEGILVSEMVSGGIETLIGVAQDQLFGPVVTVGLGGIFVEVFGDVTFRVPPFDEGEARRALLELKGYKLLQGVRGQKPVDIEALVDTVMKVQRLAMDLAGDIRELDINPFVVRPRGAVALDALVVKQ